MKNLVIVESPSKSKTIEKYLGKDYKVTSSKGHIRDLTTTGKYGLGVDLENHYKPSYKVFLTYNPFVTLGVALATFFATSTTSSTLSAFLATVFVAISVERAVIDNNLAIFAIKFIYLPVLLQSFQFLPLLLLLLPFLHLCAPTLHQQQHRQFQEQLQLTTYQLLPNLHDRQR